MQIRGLKMHRKLAKRMKFGALPFRASGQTMVAGMCGSGDNAVVPVEDID